MGIKEAHGSPEYGIFIVKVIESKVPAAAAENHKAVFENKKSKTILGALCAFSHAILGEKGTASSKKAISRDRIGLNGAVEGVEATEKNATCFILLKGDVY